MRNGVGAPAGDAGRTGEVTPLELIAAEIERIEQRLTDLHTTLRVLESLQPRLVVVETPEPEPHLLPIEACYEQGEEPEPAPLPSEAWSEPAPVEAEASEHQDGIGAALLAEVRVAAAERGISMATASRAIFGNASQLYLLPKYPTERNVARVRAFLDGAEKPKPNAEPRKLSFAQQLERVSRGEVGIIPAFKPQKQIDGTLGGVTGAINL